MSNSGMTTVLKIAVAGASGRMGRMLIEAICSADDAELSGALDVAGSPSIGADAAAFTGKLTAAGVKFDRPYKKLPNSNAASAFLTDPSGTSIELTEGLLPAK